MSVRLFPLRDGVRDFIRACRPRRIRTLAQFAEDEIIIPDGRLAGTRFRSRVQPYSGLVFSAIDAGRTPRHGWRRIILVGPTQSGKTLCGFVIPIMYHALEVGETVIVVVPDIDMVADKWGRDIRPAIARSRYRDLLPTTGEGARGGTVRSAVTLGNGVTLRFMTAGGDDQSRAAYTARVAVVTELNAFGKRKASSDEADMWRQIQGRLRSYGDRGVIYGECTVTTAAGLVWREYKTGTMSRIAMPCGYCGEYVTLNREHLVGWEEARSAVEAEALARWCCPACGTIWEPGDREVFARGSVLLHAGQEVVRGEG